MDTVVQAHQLTVLGQAPQCTYTCRASFAGHRPVGLSPVSWLTVPCLFLLYACPASSTAQSNRSQRGKVTETGFIGTAGRRNHEMTLSARADLNVHESLWKYGRIYFTEEYIFDAHTQRSFSARCDFHSATQDNICGVLFVINEP